jgi:hypothetical protein
MVNRVIDDLSIMMRLLLLMMMMMTTMMLADMVDRTCDDESSDDVG